MSAKRNRGKPGSDDPSLPPRPGRKHLQGPPLPPGKPGPKPKPRAEGCERGGPRTCASLIGPYGGLGEEPAIVNPPGWINPGGLGKSELRAKMREIMAVGMSLLAQESLLKRLTPMEVLKMVEVFARYGLGDVEVEVAQHQVLVGVAKLLAETTDPDGVRAAMLRLKQILEDQA